MDEVKKCDVSFICCLWNEYDRAPLELRKLLGTLSNVEFKWEILLIDNFSTDGTRDWMRGLDVPGVVKIFNESNLGKGGSIQKCIDAAVGGISVIFDLDGEYDSIDAIKGVGIFEEKSPVVLMASRVLAGRQVYIYYINYIGVRFLTWLINFLFGSSLTDSATGLKLFRTDFFKRNRLACTGFNADFEIVCLALRSRESVIEFAGSYHPRTAAEGKKIRAIKDGLQSIFAILNMYIGWK